MLEFGVLSLQHRDKVVEVDINRGKGLGLSVRVQDVPLCVLGGYGGTRVVG